MFMWKYDEIRRRVIRREGRHFLPPLLPQSHRRLAIGHGQPQPVAQIPLHGLAHFEFQDPFAHRVVALHGLADHSKINESLVSVMKRKLLMQMRHTESKVFQHSSKSEFVRLHQVCLMLKSRGLD